MTVPADGEGVIFADDALEELQRLTGGYPYFVQAYGRRPGTSRPAPHRRRVLAAAPDADSELAVGFFGVRYERATPAERDYLTAMADRVTPRATQRSAPRPRPTPRPQASVLVTARDGLIKKGLVFSGERGRVAFTVPHFGRLLRGRRVRSVLRDRR